MYGVSDRLSSSSTVFRKNFIVFQETLNRSTRRYLFGSTWGMRYSPIDNTETSSFGFRIIFNIFCWHDSVSSDWVRSIQIEVQFWVFRPAKRVLLRLAFYTFFVLILFRLWRLNNDTAVLNGLFRMSYAKWKCSRKLKNKQTIINRREIILNTYKLYQILNLIE